METIINLDYEIKAYFNDIGIQPQEIRKTSPLEWLGCLIDIGQTYFSGDALKIQTPEINAMMLAKQLDVYKLYYISMEYIKVSCKYNKIISYKDFSDLVNINIGTLYAYKTIKVFKDYNINDLLEYYNSNINDYINYINIYNNNNDISIYNNAICLYNYMFNSDMVNYIKRAIYNNLSNKSVQTLYKKLEGSGQGFSYALMINNNPEYQQDASTQDNSIISINSLQNRLQLAQNKGHNIQK